MKIARTSLMLLVCVAAASMMSTPAQAGGIRSITKGFRSPIRRPVIRSPRITPPSLGKVTGRFHSTRRGAARSIQRRLPRITHRDVRREAKRAGGTAGKVGRGIARGIFSKGGPSGRNGGRYGSQQTPEDSRGGINNYPNRTWDDPDDDDGETHRVNKPQQVSGSFLTRKRSNRGTVRIPRTTRSIRYPGHSGRRTYLRKPTIRYRSSTRRSYRR